MLLKKYYTLQNPELKLYVDRRTSKDFGQDLLNNCHKARSYMWQNYFINFMGSKEIGSINCKMSS